MFSPCQTSAASKQAALLDCGCARARFLAAGRAQTKHYAAFAAIPFGSITNFLAAPLSKSL